MKGSAAPEQVADAVARHIARATDADDMLEAVSAEVAAAVPHDASMWFGVDPSTLLAIAPARLEHLDGGFCEPFWHNEFYEQDTNLFADMARQGEGAATLFAATGDTPARSARYRDFLEPQGYGDELRSVLRTGSSTWGICGLFRDQGRTPFDDHDVAVVNAVSGLVADAIRTYATLSSATEGLVHSPGLMLFDRSGVIMSANDAAARWLTELFDRGQNADWMALLSDPGRLDTDPAVPIFPLIAKAHALAAGRTGGEARLRIRDRSGRWVVLHASVLEGMGTDGAVAVVVEPAKSAEIAPIIIEAYGLTPRERDVVRAIARGSSTPQIAADLFLSAHTVRDYIKSVFEKIGVTSRSEAVAKLFAEHYADPVHEAMVDIH